MDFAALEEVDGVRLTWNIWPNSKLEATKCVMPFAALYTPNRKMPTMPVLPYEAISCKQCSAVLNPYARVDFYSKVWICPFCIGRNHFPPHYQGISETALPAELYPSFTTIEYSLPRTIQPHPPVYLFLIDTCVAEDELQACKNAILQAISTLPEYIYVGLITFGTHVHVYELGFAECSKCYVFRGSKEYTTAQIVDQLGVRAAQPRSGAPAALQAAAAAAPTRRFLMPMGEAEFALNTALEELQKDSFSVSSQHRPARCTGTALQVAAALLGASLPTGNCQVRILAMIGGPCTEGSGRVVSRDLSEEMRSHKDLAKDAVPHFAKAKKFYGNVAAELVAHGHTLDMFTCALDQVGLAEMKGMVLSTGGMALQTDTFSSTVFRDSLKRLFQKETEEGFIGCSSNGVVEVIPSKDIKVAGLLGPAARLEKKSINIADSEVGLGNTCAWKLAGLDTDTTVAIVFEITANNKDNEANAAPGAQQLFLQFLTRYMHWSGELRLRVSTVTRRWIDGGAVADLITGFDQEAAAVLMARLASYKMETEEDFDATRWLDRTLIRLAQRFGDYRPDDPASFNLRPELSFYPQFMFNLRRSQFVQVFGNSPDETAYFRLMLFRVSVPDAMVMIQPQLTAYHFGGPPEPVLLDVQSIMPDRILLLDAFFYVVVFHGATIAMWRKAQYHLQPEHAAFAQLLEAPKMEAQEIAQRRFPTPKIVDCDYNGSQARFLLVKLNPSSTYSSANPLSAEVINTDDVSLSTFTEHLKRLAVQQ
ncbi:COP-II coat subunit [Dunaliella salina]|uniref:Protein transport protein SEC23 n=1 Tax=Dunaliella salina TaxID=3046 RepID=A0ABQ7H7K9_DUNSA|nr:COP-II coat subunit [Dunaliella salina]|eukprot:KAF5842832.1 COP-II coat subunit [Dunaliella salina]